MQRGYLIQGSGLGSGVVYLLGDVKILRQYGRFVGTGAKGLQRNQRAANPSGTMGSCAGCH